MSQPEDGGSRAAELLRLLSPSVLGTISLAVGVAAVASKRALIAERAEQKARGARDGRAGREERGEQDSVTLTRRDALVFPVAASVALMVMFFLFRYVQSLIVLLMASVAAGATVFTLEPVLQYAAARSRRVADLIARPTLCGASVGSTLLATTAGLLVLSWMATGHWLLNDVICAFLGCMFISFVRLPNLRICALLFGGLFVYDVFWVFFSERIFGDNVMAKVATDAATNPLEQAAELTHWQWLIDHLAHHLDLPVKFLVPLAAPQAAGDDDGDAGKFGRRQFMLLGLGDVAIPGLLLSLGLVYDNSMKRRRYAAVRDTEMAAPLLTGAGAHGAGANPAGGPAAQAPSREGSAAPGASQPSSGAGTPALPGTGEVFGAESGGGSVLRYFPTTLAAYAVGLVLTMVAGILSAAPQPALFYIVPCTYGTVVAVARLRGELHALWGGHRPRVAELEDADEADKGTA
ncbi:unnamed protein product [Pedinophyceae sp. YPF-701]|nr:unnamed protein product [Pedinophyceae sp. YPF-701]